MQTNAVAKTRLAINLAVIGANSQVAGWDEKAYKFALGYARRNYSFATEDMRKMAPEELKVRDARAWGGITRRLLEERKIKKLDRMRTSQAEGNHGRPVLMFKSLIYGRKK